MRSPAKISLIIYLSLLATLSPGCASYREIKNISQYLTKREAAHDHNKTVITALMHYFTPQAYQALKGIPVIDGPAFEGYVSGVNFWSNLVSFLSFNGVGRKVILPKEALGEGYGIESFVHEYIHHLDDMDRDGEGEWIDHEEFRKAYKLMAKDSEWSYIVVWANERADRWITDVFGIGPDSELIAYVAQKVIRNEVPDYIKQIYRHMLQIP